MRYRLRQVAFWLVTLASWAGGVLCAYTGLVLLVLGPVMGPRGNIDYPDFDAERKASADRGAVFLPISGLVPLGLACAAFVYGRRVARFVTGFVPNNALHATRDDARTLAQTLDPMSAHVRPARRSDIAGMRRVRMSVQENRLISVALSDQDYLTAIKVIGRGWVVELHGIIVAFAVANSENGSIWALFVEPGHEGKGYGRQLHEMMVAWLWEQGHRRLWLTTDPGTRAERFYEGAGWKRVGSAAQGEVRFELERPNNALQATCENARA